MKTIKNILIVITVFCVLSCSSDNSSNEETKATVKDIYVCGYEKKTNEGKFIATVWKNGVATSLTDGTKNADAYDIFVAGKNIYVVGSELNSNGDPVAKIWINGAPQILTDEPNSYGEKVIVSNNDIYVLFYVLENDSYVRKIWKDGVISETQGGVTNFAVNNGDVYMVGYDGQYAMLWKNGVGSKLTNGEFSSVANDIEIKDNNVYIVGSEQSNAKLWKNGVGSNLIDGNLSRTAKEISIVGDDIYVSGITYNPFTFRSLIWKNGEEIWSLENFETIGLKVVGKDFFMISNSNNTAKLVKNGVAENLSSSIYSTATGLFITTN